MTQFKDHFSKQSADYARFRPNYPPALFDYLATLAPSREKAWDCATGSGQAALALARHFERVVATDASAQQIRNATRHPDVTYSVTRAENTDLDAESCDLITVAQAVHWFEFDAFYVECKRVLTPEGVLALWCYNLMTINPEIDEIVLRFYSDVVGDYWPPERKWIEGNYEAIPFPYEEIELPIFQMQAEWCLSELVGYLNTWSATQRCFEKTGQHPLEQIESDLRRAWGNPSQRKQVSWPLYLKVGKKRRHKNE